MKKRTKLLASLMISTQLLTIVSTVSAAEVGVVDPYVEPEAYTSDYQERYDTYMANNTYSDDLKAALEGLKVRSAKIETNEQLNVLINDFTSVHTLMSNKDAARFYADTELMGYSLSLDVYTNIKTAVLKDGNASRIIRFANQLGMGVTEGVRGYQDLLQDLTSANTIKGAQAELDEIERLVTMHRESLGSGTNLRLEIVAGKMTSPDLGGKVVDGGGIAIPDPGKVIVDDTRETGVTLSNETEGDEPTAITDTVASSPERSGSYFEFDAEKGERIRVDYTIKVEKGEEKRSEKRTVEAKELKSMWSDRYSEFFTTTIETTQPEWVKEAEEKEEVSSLTLQYSLNKEDLFPVYVDTGLFTDVDGNTQYEDLYDVLYQIAVNTDDGYLVEDTNKLLVIAEGQPVYILEEKEVYSQEEVTALFASFSDVELLIAETRIGTSDSLEWQLRTGQAQAVMIDDEAVDLATSPQVRGERVVLPVIEMMEAIGATIEIEEEEHLITARYDEFVITFETGVADARIDEELIKLDVPVEPNEHGVITTNLMPIFEAIGLDSVWDEQESTLYLNETLRHTLSEQSEPSEEDKKEKTDKKDIAEDNVTDDESVTEKESKTDNDEEKEDAEKE